MKSYPFQTIAEYAEHRRLSQERQRDNRILLIFAFVGSMALGGLIVGQHHKPERITIEGPSALISKSTNGDAKMWSKWDAAATAAIRKWKAVVPGALPDGFEMVADKDACGPKAIACADSTRNTIFVVQDGNDVDRMTIMMHEIGHLLGVPHLDGDALMDPAYQGTALDAPSDAAIALATLHVHAQTSITVTAK